MRGTRGTVVVFWATWCGHCLAELAELDRLHAWSSPCGVPVVGVSLDVWPRGDLARWLQRQAVVWPQVFDGRGYNSPLARLYRVEVLPYTVVLGPTGDPVASGLRGPELAMAVHRLCSKM